MMLSLIREKVATMALIDSVVTSVDISIDILSIIGYLHFLVFSCYYYYYYVLYTLVDKLPLLKITIKNYITIVNKLTIAERLSLIDNSLLICTIPCPIIYHGW